MLTTYEMMRSLYLRGGEFSEEARAWLEDRDQDEDRVGLIARALDDLEEGEIDEEAALSRIARAIDHSLCKRV